MALDQPGSGRPPHHVLLAEDVSANIALYRAVLTKAGYLVVVAPDGAMAVDLALERARTAAPGFDIVLMDLGLPKLDGLEAARRIRAGGLSTPIYALTAEDDAATRRACQAAGMNGYLTKPLSPLALVSTVREALA